MQAVEDHPMRGREGLTALRVGEVPALARMDANMALTDLAFGWTRQMGAACCSGVHAYPPSSVGECP